LTSRRQWSHFVPISSRHSICRVMGANKSFAPLRFDSNSGARANRHCSDRSKGRLNRRMLEFVFF
jgi:hypothetical protein